MPNKPSDFRYNTGPSRVPWAAVGENYNASDIIALIKFLIMKNDEEYDDALKEVEAAIQKLSRHGKAPGKLSLGENVSLLEEKVNEYLETNNATFITNATAGFEIA